jgi:hypothetical protein
MRIRAKRVVIDTNLWISYLITKDFKKLDEYIKTGKLRLLFSLDLMEEFLEVTNRPKFKKYFAKPDVEKLIDLFEVYGEMISVKSDVAICRDAKDNFLLSLAKDARADFLVTGDSDLLDLEKFEKTQITSIKDFLKKLS